MTGDRALTGTPEWERPGALRAALPGRGGRARVTYSGGFDAAWLPADAFHAVGSRCSLLRAADGPLVDTMHGELASAYERFGERVVRGGGEDAELVLELADGPDDEGFALTRRDGATTVTASGEQGLLHGFFHVVRLGEDAFAGERAREEHRPAFVSRMLDHWDNVAVHPVMGQVERGYAGGSLFWTDGRARGDPDRVWAYG